MEAFLRNQILNVCRGGRHHHRIRDARRLDAPKQPRYERVDVDGEILSYIPNDGDKIGVYIAAGPLTPEDSYFEIEVLDIGKSSTISVGLAPYSYPLNVKPGTNAYSVAYHGNDGRLYICHPYGKYFAPACNYGDRIGVGIKFSEMDTGEFARSQKARIFFTRNGTELGTVSCPLPAGGLYPIIGLNSRGEEIKLIRSDFMWTNDDVILMAVDSVEDEWARLHDVRMNGNVLEYAGRGRNIHDVGLAQARLPLDTTHHYFELEVVDPGDNCYIAIGVARKNYPKHRHPGWNRGSIAYHADDGKLFVGSGAGDAFGPKCHKGDIMGCGILFPSDYDGEADYDLSPDESEEPPPADHDELLSDSDEEDDAIARMMEQNGTQVEVFFTRNGKMVGKHVVKIPKGGLYPTIGMLSSREKVRVDLRPLTG